MSEEFTYIACSHIGVAGTIDVVIKETADGFEARCGIAILGHTNMDEQGFKNCNHDPFHEEFYDNYAHGFGKTRDEAIENLKKDMSKTADSIWAI